MYVEFRRLRRSVVTLGLVLCTAVAMTTACSNSSNSQETPAPTPTPTITIPTNTYSENGVTFQYPKSWKTQKAQTAASTGEELWSETIGPAKAVDNLAILSAYKVSVEVTHDNVDQFRPNVEASLSQIAAQAGGSVTEAVTAESTGGLPGYRARLRVLSTAEKPVDSTVWLMFNGTTEYFLNCQYQPKQAKEIMAGCDVIRQTFTVTS